MYCPICKKKSNEKYKPFCTFRCKQIDLFNWLNEKYTIPNNIDTSSEDPKKND